MRNLSFQPLKIDAIHLLSAETGIDFMQTEFSREHEWLCCTVRGGGGKIRLVAVFEFKNAFDAHVTTVCADKTVLTRRFLTYLIGTVFLRAKRITALVRTDNLTALQQVWRMGFIQEGYLRRGFDGEHDAHLFGLVPEDCPYLMGHPFRIMHESRNYHPANATVN